MATSSEGLSSVEVPGEVEREAPLRWDAVAPLVLPLVVGMVVLLSGCGSMGAGLGSGS